MYRIEDKILIVTYLEGFGVGSLVGRLEGFGVGSYEGASVLGVSVGLGVSVNACTHV